jgi:hypothetical protein
VIGVVADDAGLRVGLGFGLLLLGACERVSAYRGPHLPWYASCGADGGANMDDRVARILLRAPMIIRKQRLSWDAAFFD